MVASVVSAIQSDIGGAFIPVSDIEAARDWYCRSWTDRPRETFSSGIDSKSFVGPHVNKPVFHFNAHDLDAARTHVMAIGAGDVSPLVTVFSSHSTFAEARLSSLRKDPALNCFGVDASQPLSVWRAKGWIHPDDPRGWFQWYCRYHQGRRMPGEDERQVARWKAIRRHIAQLRRACEPGDCWCRPRQRQALLRWAYDSRSI
ncbi:hypothetical protein [Sinorhizobium terangae]|uniref:hypothetical protein n=1 Tax=Sinorhizobium terangae TaxID=110322 RepID=UPI0024B14BF1|nr:hypothetical protein [Sinorhizobium terangae]WFU50777.1 hypothetical protein QA637_19330 [Sinorhizobium terangae]